MKYPEALALLAELPKDTLCAIADVSGDDGHTLFDPVAYVKAGLTMELTSYFTQPHRSDGQTAKGSIFREGEVVPEVTGIYGLTVLEHISNALELPMPVFHGRGFKARALHTAIKAACSTPATPTLAAAAA